MVQILGRAFGRTGRGKESQLPSQQDMRPYLGTMRDSHEQVSTLLSRAAFMRYIEADIAGTVGFPTGVQLVLASFSQLFGTTAGAQLQTWCIQQGWPLAWALGDGGIPALPQSTPTYRASTAASTESDEGG